MSYDENKIKTIFIGTPDFAVPSLRALTKDKSFDIMAVVTQPDKKVGRKQIITPPPVKIEALKYKIEVWQPAQISNFQFPISNVDLIVVTAYAQKLPENILKLPKYGCINVHASLLPKYRGASPVQAAIMDEDKETGVTIIKMDKEIDTGPILTKKSLTILPNDTAGTITEKLSSLGAKILTLTLKEYIRGNIKPLPQDNSQASYTGRVKKEDGRIDWIRPAYTLERFIRAMNPWPVAWTKLDNKILKILTTKYEPLKINKYKTGELFLYNDELAVQCGQDSLIIKQLQLEGRKMMASEEFLRGHKESVGKILT